jgi:hypothetical protein
MSESEKVTKIVELLHEVDSLWASLEEDHYIVEMFVDSIKLNKDYFPENVFASIAERIVRQKRLKGIEPSQWGNELFKERYADGKLS